MRYLTLFFCCALALRAAEPQPTEIAATLQRVAAWQMANPTGTDTRDWVIAPLYDGLIRAARVTGDASILAPVIALGQQSGWQLGDRLYHADDHAVGHAWLDLYAMDPSQTERMSRVKARLDEVLQHPITELLRMGQSPETPGLKASDRWSWCDALYMAPPTLARLYKLTGDKRYGDFLDQEYRLTYRELYDPQEHLFFRDHTFLEHETPSGAKVFWSRGNGWVYGGLPMVLEALPAGHASRAFYEQLFREMTDAIVATQHPDGLWRPSLLDHDHVPVGETSGSGFFIFGLAWGINHGLLDRATYLPAVIRGWQGLLTRISPSGLVGYVQPIGAAPDVLKASSTFDYGTGAVLLAGSEIYRTLGGTEPTPPAKLLAQAEALLAATANQPRAYARLVPERLDDLAWENDKVAFRIYGPALRDGPEDSGIDAWTKRVPYPVLDRWYAKTAAGKGSYHRDTGEGYDGYHVGNSRGCGGLGLWIEGKLVTADTYISADILWTAPDVAKFRAVYRYAITWQGEPLYEHRIVTLRMGERLAEHDSVFSSSPTHIRRYEWPDFGDQVAIGLVSQSASAHFTSQPENGLLACFEPFGQDQLGTGILVDPSHVIGTAEIPDADPAGQHRQSLLLLRPMANGHIRYRSGFAWSADGEITSEAGWLAYLQAQR